MDQVRDFRTHFQFFLAVLKVTVNSYSFVSTTGKIKFISYFEEAKEHYGIEDDSMSIAEDSFSEDDSTIEGGSSIGG